MTRLALLLISLIMSCISRLLYATGSPKSTRSSAMNNIKAFGIPAAAAALIPGKAYLDGPTFKENVSMKGKTVVLTGGNSGLGKETAVKLASLGAQVLILCRNPSAAAKAVDEIKRRSGSSLVEALQMDLANLGSIESCVKELKSKVGDSGIDVVLNNAGVMAIPTKEVTDDGFERQIGINHLGHFAFTSKLFQNGLIGKGADTTRIINVASTAHMFGDIEAARRRNDLMLQKDSSYKARGAYGNSKLANILFTNELARRLRKSGKGNKVATFSLHPGVCRTELGRYIVDPSSIPKLLYPVVGVAAVPFLYFTKSAEQGAQTQIFLSATQKLDLQRDSGKYFDNSRAVKPSSAARDDDTAAWLWAESERLTGIKFNV